MLLTLELRVTCTRTRFGLHLFTDHAVPQHVVLDGRRLCRHLVKVRSWRAHACSPLSRPEFGIEIAGISSSSHSTVAPKPAARACAASLVASNASLKAFSRFSAASRRA